MQKFHFISGLPRSGSTMLAALLRQNPAVYANMSGPVASLFEGVIDRVSAGSELSSMVNDAQRARILKGLFDSFYADREEQVIFDTNRAWTAKLPALMHLFPDSKLICCVRDVAWIMDSMERQYRSNTFENTRLFNSHAERSTVYTRLEALAHATRLVGFPYQALREACWSDFANRLVIIDYDIMVQRPGEVLGLIYEFLGEPAFEHNFDQVEYDAPEFDTQLGVGGLHRVHKQVAPRPRKTILPPDLFQKYSGMAFWRDLENCAAYRIVSQPATDDAQSPE